MVQVTTHKKPPGASPPNQRREPCPGLAATTKPIIRVAAYYLPAQSAEQALGKTRAPLAGARTGSHSMVVIRQTRNLLVASGIVFGDIELPVYYTNQ